MLLHKITYKVKLLGKLRSTLTKFATISVYKAMILSLFDIGSVFYDSASNVQLRKLQVLQNKALRVIFKLGPRTNVDKAHQKVKLMLLESRRKLHIAQLASWLSTVQMYRDCRELPTRAHSELRRNLKIEKI